jgi:hypothetical protein
VIWWDRHIPPGRIFDEVIDEALQHARSVVVLWSQHAVKSNYVLSEASTARQRGILLPILLEPVPIPLEFRRIQAVHFADWDGTGTHPAFVTLYEAIIRAITPPDWTNAFEPLRAYVGEVNFTNPLYIKTHKASILAALRRIALLDNKHWPDRALVRLPAISQMVYILKNAPDEDIRVAAIESLVSVRRPEDAESEDASRVILTIAAEQDPSATVVRAAQRGLKLLAE